MQCDRRTNVFRCLVEHSGQTVRILANYDTVEEPLAGFPSLDRAPAPTFPRPAFSDLAAQTASPAPA